MVGCGEATEQDKSVRLRGNFSVEEAWSFKEFPLFYAGAEGGYRLEIQTGASTVVIFGRRDRMQKAVDALEGLNVPVEAGAPLPSPVPGALDGTLPC
jgi:hypothetical protein